MRTKRFLLLALALGLCLVVSTRAQDADPADRVPGEVLVKFAQRAPPAAVLGAAQAVGAEHLRSFDRIGVRHWRVGNGLTVDGAIAILEKRPSVEFAEPNYLVQAHQPPDDPLVRTGLWGMHNNGQTGGTRDADIDAVEAWGIRSDASAVVVADIDTGVEYTHEDLAANMWINPGEDLDGNGVVDESDFNGVDDDGNGLVDDLRGWDFVQTSSTVLEDNDPMDDNDHGTHTAGTIGAVGDNGRGVAGVCWRVRIMPVKFLDSNGSGSNADAISAILYAASFEDGAGSKVVRITSNSWGGGSRSKALEDAIRDSGALFVASAGNSGSSQVMYPAGYSLDNILSVAATDYDDGLASFSNFSTSWVDLGAPGVGVVSCGRGDTYLPLDGTSMAAPHCAGAAALVLAGSPGLSVAQLKQALMDSVDHIPALAGKTVTGGRLNLFRALGGSPSDPPPEALTDTTAPDAVSDLSAGDATSRSVTLSFTASADDGSLAGSGPAYAYDIRVLVGEAVTDGNWDGATRVQGDAVPGTPGSAEAVTVSGLWPATTYFFAVKVVDEEGNVSGISNPASATTPPLPPGSWLVETVDWFGLVGTTPSIELDAAGYPHIAYQDQTWPRRAKYARWTGAAWSVETIPDSASAQLGWQTSLALDASGIAHVTYRDITNNNLRYAKRSGPGWSVETVDAGGHASSLEVDANGFPHVAYGGGTGGLRYARWNGSQWVKQTVDASGASGSLTLLGSNPLISYVSETQSGTGKNKTTIRKLMLARWTGSSWQLEVVDPTGLAGSLALDGSGNPRISYVDGTGNPKYASWSGSSWQIQVVPAAGSLALDAAGNPHISFYVKPDVKYARWTGSAWDIETVGGAGNIGGDGPSSLALDSLGNPHIAYREYNNSDGYRTYDLKYALKLP